MVSIARIEVKVRSGNSSEARGRSRYSSSSQVFLSDSTSCRAVALWVSFVAIDTRLVIGQLAIDVGDQVRSLFGVQTLLGT